jgi:hypothetical protein
MAPPSSRNLRSDTGRARHRNDGKMKATDPKQALKDLKRKSLKLPPGLREEEDDEDWPPKYKKAPPPPKIRKPPANHPRTGRKLWVPNPVAPVSQTDRKVSPERAFDVYDPGWRNTTEGDLEVYERRMRMLYESVSYSSSRLLTGGSHSDSCVNGVNSLKRTASTCGRK